MIRERLTITVDGSNHGEVKQKVSKIVSEYFGVEAGDLSKSVDIELDVVSDKTNEGRFNATAYVKVKN